MSNTTATERPPVARRFGDRLDQPSPAFLQFTVVFILLCGLAYLGVVLIVAPTQTPRVWSVSALIALATVAWAFLRAGKTQATVVMLSAGVWSYVTLTSFFFGGVDGTAIIVYVPIILLVGWLVGARASVLVAALTVATTLSLVVVEMAGALPTPPPTPPLVRWVAQSGVFVLSAVLLLAAVRSYRRRLEEVHELSAALEGVLAATADGILAVDRDGRVIQANRRFAELWRIPPDILARGDDRALLDFVAGQLRDPAAFRATVEALYHSDTEDTDTVEFTDGRVFERVTAPLVLKGANVGRVWSFRDITQRTRAARALAESRQLLQTVVDTAPVRVFWKDRDLRYLGCNPAFARDAGVDDPAEIVGKTDFELGWAEHAEAYRADDRSVIADGQPKLSYEEQQTTPDGRQIWLRTSKVPLRGHDQETLGVLGVYEDVTERKRVEQRLAMAIDVTGVVLWEADFASGALAFDRAMLPVLGLSADEPPRDLQRWIARIHPDDRDAFGAAFEAALRPGDPVFDFEYRMIDGHGGVEWVHTRGRVAQRTAAGVPVLAVGTSTNVSAQRRAQESLQQSEERSRTLASMLRRMCDNVPDMIWAKDLDGRYLFANRAMSEHLLGARDTEEPVGRTDLFFAQRERATRPDDPTWHTFGDECRDTDLVTLEQGTTCVFEESGTVKGEHRVLDVHKSPFFDELGRVVGTVGSARDVTSRQAADRALRESEQRLATVFKACPIGIIITRMSDGTVLDLNEAALGLLADPRERIVGATVFDLGIYDDRAAREAVIRELEAAGAVDQHPVRFRNRAGDVRDVELAVRAIELQGERCLVTMMVDVTDRKRLEEAHLQAQKLASLGTLAGGIAHDFNNILLAIRGNTELVADELRPQQAAAESLDEIRRATMRASDLVRRIMAFGRPKEARHEVVDLGVVVTEVLKLLRSTLPASVSLVTEFGAGSAYVLADAGQVHEAIVNLTTNAAQAIGSRPGRITYRLDSVVLDDNAVRGLPGLAAGRHARLVVGDDGCGIGADVIDRIFDAFYTTKAVGEGTGLGLSMVHGIMRSHNGAVTVRSAPGQGSTFTLYFPAVAPPVPSPSPTPPSPSRPVASGRVLFIDDEGGLVSLATRALERQGYAVRGFTDARAALAEFQVNREAYDVVVTDLAMPHLSGLDVARQVFALRPGMPVLLTTGYMRPDDEAGARAVGIRTLVMKPYGVDELGEVLARMLDGA